MTPHELSEIIDCSQCTKTEYCTKCSNFMKSVVDGEAHPCVYDGDYLRDIKKELKKRGK